ncbi:MAG: ATP-binding protein [Anaerolineae bacterium]|nr:ATP-binding protein [Anaerolineae bacterium]
MQKNLSESESNLDFDYLQAELARIDLMIRRQIHLWQLAGQDPNDSFRGLYVSDADVAGMLNRPLGGNWGQGVALSPEEAKLFGKAKAKAEAESNNLMQLATDQGQTLRLLTLASAFNLDRFAVDVLLIALAPTLDLRYEKVYAYLQDDVTRKRPAVNLVLDLLNLQGAERFQYMAHFAENAPLRRFQLIDVRGETGAPLLSHTLHVDTAIVAWLLGAYQPQATWRDYVGLYQPVSRDDDLLPTQETQALLTQIASTEKPVLIFYGEDAVSQKIGARFLTQHLRKNLLTVDVGAVMQQADLTPQQILQTTFRDARLTSAVPFLTNWDACFNKSGEVPAHLMTELGNYPGLVIVGGEKRWQANNNQAERLFMQLEFPIPAYHQRLALWQHFLTQKIPIKSSNLQSLISNLQLPTLAGQFALTTGQIRDAVAAACGIAAQNHTDLTEEILFTTARAYSNPRLEALARKIVPRYGWSDIILPDDQMKILEEIIDTVRGRPQVLEQWGVGQKLVSGAAITILFAGDPGTGKTMAAEVIANQLKLDLYKIDLSTVVSKYIGETEKNLEKIFSEAESSNAILFFDEADAIFGKRSEVKDAHDRYANIEVSYLLQRMEAYNGVTILATNLRANLDEAFTRRLQFVVDFPFPEKEDRLRIWQTLFPAEVPQAAELNFEVLAHRFKLAGGSIRNIIVNAAYQAAANGGQVTMGHLMHGTRRELQKMGRFIEEDELKL